MRPRDLHEQHRATTMRVAMTAACVVFAAGFAFALSVVAQGAIPQPVYFFTNTTQPLDKHNPLVVRPSGFLLFQDGQWVLQDLHWKHWGSSVARATGISNASDGIPDAARGKRIKTPARVMLSKPGRFRGHEVYRCFTLTVPAHPSANQHLCIKRTGSLFLLQ